MVLALDVAAIAPARPVVERGKNSLGRFKGGGGVLATSGMGKR